MYYEHPYSDSKSKQFYSEIKNKYEDNQIGGNNVIDKMINEDSLKKLFKEKKKTITKDNFDKLNFENRSNSTLYNTISESFIQQILIHSNKTNIQLFKLRFIIYDFENEEKKLSNLRPSEWNQFKKTPSDPIEFQLSIQFINTSDKYSKNFYFKIPYNYEKDENPILTMLLREVNIPPHKKMSIYSNPKISIYIDGCHYQGTKHEDDFFANTKSKKWFNNTVYPKAFGRPAIDKENVKNLLIPHISHRGKYSISIIFNCKPNKGVEIEMKLRNTTELNEGIIKFINMNIDKSLINIFPELIYRLNDAPSSAEDSMHRYKDNITISILNYNQGEIENTIKHTNYNNNYSKLKEAEDILNLIYSDDDHQTGVVDNQSSPTNSIDGRSLFNIPMNRSLFNIPMNNINLKFDMPKNYENLYRSIDIQINFFKNVNYWSNDNYYLPINFYNDIYIITFCVRRIKQLMKRLSDVSLFKPLNQLKNSDQQYQTRLNNGVVSWINVFQQQIGKYLEKYDTKEKLLDRFFKIHNKRNVNVDKINFNSNGSHFKLGNVKINLNPQDNEQVKLNINYKTLQSLYINPYRFLQSYCLKDTVEHQSYNVIIPNKTIIYLLKEKMTDYNITNLFNAEMNIIFIKVPISKYTKQHDTVILSDDIDLNTRMYDLSPHDLANSNVDNNPGIIYYYDVSTPAAAAST